MGLKKVGKNILCKLLESQVRRLRRKHSFQVIAVAGSVGKTSTKLAIAKTLSTRQQVIYQDGNYNDRLTVPLVLFGHTEPGIFNIAAWCKILLANRRAINKEYPFDVAVLELGTDAPGQLRQFAYLEPELTVITAVAAEHMEFFGSLDKVAAEELSTLAFSKRQLLNLDDIDGRYLPSGDFLGYGQHAKADYRLTTQSSRGLDGQELTLSLPGGEQLQVQTHVLGSQGDKIILAAAAVAHLNGWDAKAIQEGLAQITPTPGRMQLLTGANGSHIIDDTYNASPVAVEAALKVLESISAPRRIAILGTMNELGSASAEEHERIGRLCDPGQLSLVITIGEVAQKYLAPAAKARGCQVMSFLSPYEAGEYVRQHLQPGAVVLAKGSQNGVFAEEAVKLLLQHPQDANRLVRQSPYWQTVKSRQFPSVAGQY